MPDTSPARAEAERRLMVQLGEEPEWAQDLRKEFNSRLERMPDNPSQEQVIEAIMLDIMDKDHDRIGHLMEPQHFENGGIADDFDAREFMQGVPVEDLLPIYQHLQEMYRNPKFHY